ncbi:MAG: hypothetical protein ACR2HJ_07820 [Fimbriimonadales bacterium]
MYKHGGTGFFVAMSGEKVDGHFSYLVTARHNIVKATEHGGGLYISINLVSGARAYVKVTGDWIFHENDADDVAILPIMMTNAMDCARIEHEIFATEDEIRELDIGIGDDVAVPGLFTERYGVVRNIPILRTGTLAAMPEEPLEDVSTGLPYDAYLIESRSIGGLSGSPVFAVKEPGHLRGLDVNMSWHLRLIGLVRGHWDHQMDAEGWRSEELKGVNMGIAIITPVSKITDILMSELLVKARRKEEKKYLDASTPTHDFGLNAPTKKEQFEADLRKASTKKSKRSDQGTS